MKPLAHRLNHSKAANVRIDRGIERSLQMYIRRRMHLNSIEWIAHDIGGVRWPGDPWNKA